MELTEENAEKLNVGNHPGALLCKGLLLDAITAGDALEAKVKNLEAEREISNSYDDAWKMAERIHELEKALESRLKVIEDSRAQIETLTKALSENAIGHDWLAEKDLIEADNAAMKKRIKELEAIPHTDNTAVIAELSAENKKLRKQVPVWHQCEYANADGLYDLPPENGEYIVQFRTRAGKLVTTACEFDVDYDDWDHQPYGSTAIQWCELPTAPALKQNLITENKAGN